MIRRHLRAGDKVHHFGHKGLVHVIDDEDIIQEALPNGVDVLVPVAGHSWQTSARSAVVRAWLYITGSAGTWPEVQRHCYIRPRLVRE